MKIDNQPIDPAELSAEFRRLMQSQADRPEDLKLGEEQVRRLAVENVINKHLVVREAKKRFPTVKMDEIRRRAAQLQERYGNQFDPSRYQAEMEDDVRVDKLVGEINRGAPRVSDEEARAEYEADPSAWAEPERVHVSHIVRHTFGGADAGRSLQEILEAQRMLKAGQPFEAVAKRFSDQHGQAGDLGTFARGAMVDKFENVVFRMKPGETSDVFQTEFGYHIALVHEKHPAKPRSFEQAKGDVVRTIRERREHEAFDAFVASLREAATIERDEEDSPAEDADAASAGDDERAE
ncbi:MAG: peptidylprolyl isomerase [bacterium]